MRVYLYTCTMYNDNLCTVRMQGIKYRGKEEAVGGWFSQIGQMHVAHHLWGTKCFTEQ